MHKSAKFLNYGRVLMCPEVVYPPTTSMCMHAEHCTFGAQYSATDKSTTTANLSCTRLLMKSLETAFACLWEYLLDHLFGT